jgi:pyruvate dehydrogenase E2 component (dihydrolipoamide acetyltransferase)
VIELTMPRLSDSMEQGTILTWLKADGEQVQAGEDLLEIETDKATVTQQSEASGILQIIAPEGTTLPVGAPIAHIGVAGESPAAAPAAIESNGRSRTAHVDPSPRPGGDGEGPAVRATPLARRAAKAHGVPLEEVVGSGPLGRVTRGDVLAKAGNAVADAVPRPSARPERPRTSSTRPPEPRPATQAPGVDAPAVEAPAVEAPAVEAPGVDAPAVEAPAPSAKGQVEVVEPTRLQSVVARRMAEAKATVPHFHVQTEVIMDAAAAFRAELADAGATAPSFNDLIVKAAALALRDHPLANGAYRDGRFELYSRINIGIAVAAEHTLVVPTIFDADQKSMGTIAAESRRLASRVRDGTVSPAELSGATFTVSNLGMYGMTAITPVINPPQAAILGVGAIRGVLARVDGDIVDQRLMTLTLSCDHRILYGADAAAFLSRIRELLEQPLRLAL